MGSIGRSGDRMVSIPGRQWFTDGILMVIEKIRKNVQMKNIQNKKRSGTAEFSVCGGSEMLDRKLSNNLD